MSIYPIFLLFEQQRFGLFLSGISDNSLII